LQNPELFTENPFATESSRIMNDDFESKPRLEHEELLAEFAALFPKGWAGPDVLAELAPEGWAASPLVAVYHPSAAQVYEETLRFRRNLESLPFKKKPDAPPPPPKPTLAEIEAEHEETPIEAERECQELVGLCLWDIFSDNHEVIADDGRVLDLGSMRSGGGFLADVLNKQDGPKPRPKPEPEFFTEMFSKMSGGGPAQAELFAAMRKEMVGDGGYTYLDFYMGSSMIGGRADLQPVYEMIFRRLYKRGMDWKYVFPRLYAVDLRPLGKAMEEKKRQESGEPEWGEYDPSAAFEKEQEEAERDRSLAEMRDSLDESHREAVEAAREAEPPSTVQAYRAVYGEFPEGWPPVVS
jgi:hypothetical protein